MTRTAMAIERPTSPLDALMARYRSVRTRSEALARPLSPEDCVVQSMPDASPVKWHLAHTTWFFETFVLAPHARGYEVFHPAFCFLFNSYYNAVGERHPRPERGMLTRPPLDEVLAYRRHVDAAMERLADEPRPLAEGTAGIVELGINHEEQHQELILTDVKHLLSRNALAPSYVQAVEVQSTSRAEPLRWMRFEGGVREIGAAGHAFHFDNEGPRHRVLLCGYDLASRPVTCGEYRSFMRDGGYRRPELWLSMGWDAIRMHGWQAPMYWKEHEGTWKQFTLHGTADIDDDAPVCHVSYFEADAYARWAGARLPSEFEWEAAGAGEPVAGNLLETGALHPTAGPTPASQDGLRQLYGDVWEWTQSSYAPYPGYRPVAGAVGEYNGKFMCNQYVLRGGSCATPQRHIRATYRNFFPPDARWQFSGLRLAKDAS